MYRPGDPEATAVSMGRVRRTCLAQWYVVSELLLIHYPAEVANILSAQPESCHPGLDDPVVKPVLLRTLHSIAQLLVETRNLNARYDVEDSKSTLRRSSCGLDVFRTSFDDFEAAIHRNQKQKSVKAVTRWAIHDANKFEVITSRLKGFIDGLQDITRWLGVLADQKARLKQEIESISDTESLRLICDVGSEDVADVARQQLEQCEVLPVAQEAHAWGAATIPGQNQGSSSSTRPMDHRLRSEFLVTGAEPQAPETNRDGEEVESGKTVAHSQERLYPCTRFPLCGLSFTSFEDLLKHVNQRGSHCMIPESLQPGDSGEEAYNSYIINPSSNPPQSLKPPHAGDLHTVTTSNTSKPPVGELQECRKSKILCFNETI